MTTKLTLLFVQSPRSPVTCNVTPTGMVNVALLPELTILKSPLTVKLAEMVKLVLLAIDTLRLPPYELLTPVGQAGPELCVHVSALKLELVPLDILAWQSGEAKEHCAFAAKDRETSKHTNPSDLKYLFIVILIEAKATKVL